MAVPPGPLWPTQTVLRVQQGVLLDAPMVPTWGSRAWAATLWPDQRAAGGWARDLMAPGPTGRGYVADRLTPGDVVEFGADYQAQTGRKQFETVARRWYGVVLATAPTHVVALGPFPGPEPARQWAERAMQAWRQSLLVDVPGITDLSAPPGLPAPRDATVAAPPVQQRNAGDMTRVDDPTHGRLVVDTAVFAAAMSTDTAELVGLLGGTRDRAGHPVLTGAEPKATLAALAALGAPENFAVDAGAATTAPLPVLPAGGHDAVYYGHPDGTVERADHRGSRALHPAMQWSPDGFAWGYRGDSPTELAHALLADSTGSADVARRQAVRYCSEVIATLPQGQAWSLPVGTVAAWAAEAEQRTPIVASSRNAPDQNRDVGAGL